MYSIMQSVMPFAVNKQLFCFTISILMLYKWMYMLKPYCNNFVENIEMILSWMYTYMEWFILL